MKRMFKRVGSVIAFLLYGFLNPGFVFSQNLVPNPSFEIFDTSNCLYLGTYDKTILIATPWFEPYASSDYYSSVLPPGRCSNPVPSTAFPLYFQYPRTGNAFAGIYCYYSSPNVREYIEVPLLAPLIQGKKYNLSFYVNLLDSSRFGIDRLGGYFSIDSIITNNTFPLLVIPQVSNPTGNIIEDRVNWVLISGSFFAQGGERFLTIGNFFIDDSTNVDTTSTVCCPAAYYFIDDVSVIEDTGTGVSTTKSQPQNYFFKAYPTVSSGRIAIQYSIQKGEQAEIQLISMQGVLEHSQKLNSNQKKVIIEDRFNSGIYLLRYLVGGIPVKTEKIVIVN